MQPSKADRARVSRWVKKWRKVLLLQTHEFELFYEDEDPDEAERCMASYLDNAPYLNATITIYSKFWEKSREIQEQTVLHELSHAVTFPLKGIVHRILVDEKFASWNEAKASDERVADMLMHIVWNLTH